MRRESLSVLQMSSKGSGIRLSDLSAVPSIERLDLLGDRGRKKDSNGITTTNQQLTRSKKKATFLKTGAVSGEQTTQGRVPPDCN
jgi:hypothetical protein